MYKVFVQPASELTRLTDVTLSWPEGAIGLADGELALEHMDEVLAWRPQFYGRSIAAGSTHAAEFASRSELLRDVIANMSRQRDKLPELDPEVNYIYMAHPFGFYAFGHLFDSLQRLIHTVGKVPDPFKVIHFDAARIIDFEAHMANFGVLPSQLELVTHSVRVNRLWISPWQTHPAGLTGDAFRSIFDRYTMGKRKSPRTRLYLTRNHIRPGARGVLNETEVLVRLKDRGFQVLDGLEPLDELVQLFHQAEVVVAPHGSLLANTMFCQSDCTVIEYCPSNRVDRSFKNKTKLCKDYRHQLIAADERHNIEIPLQHLDLQLSLLCF
jgi:hypothetical protein